MILKQILLAVIGLSSGFGIAGGIFAFILSIGVINRMAASTHTARHILMYEDSILLGSIFGNVLSLFHLSLPAGLAAEILFGLFSGIFTGCLAIALAEALDLFPVLMRRANIYRGLGLIILFLALGKMSGTLLQFYMGWKK